MGAHCFVLGQVFRHLHQGTSFLVLQEVGLDDLAVQAGQVEELFGLGIVRVETVHYQQGPLLRARCPRTSGRLRGRSGNVALRWNFVAVLESVGGHPVTIIVAAAGAADLVASRPPLVVVLAFNGVVRAGKG